MTAYCPLCRGEGCTVVITLTDEPCFRCESCGDEFDPGTIRDMIKGASVWKVILEKVTKMTESLNTPDDAEESQ